MSEDEYYFCFSASFRIMDASEKHSEIEIVTGLKATHSHKKGDLKSQKTGKKWYNDIWLLDSPLPEENSLSEHLCWLSERLLPHLDYFRKLMESGVKLDIFCGYRSNCCAAGFEVDHEALDIFTKLKTPFGVSVMVDTP